MTDTLIPYSFIPGTKAKAQEVNANFIALAESITGNTTTLNSTKLNKDLSNITQNGIDVIKNNTAPPRNIGEIISSTIPLTDSGLHLLNGALISGSGSYAEFVDYIAGLVTDYPDLFETEANWQTSVTTYGVCGKFVYDSSNNTVRLPKITGFIEGTTDLTALGDLVEAGLPNITGKIGVNGLTQGNVNLSKNGAFSGTVGNETMNGSTISSSNGNTKINFNASLSNSIYGNSNTVQPQTIKVLYYIVISTATKTEIQVDIDEIATDLNCKADTDLTNCTNVANIKMAYNAMPSGTYTELTLGASNSEYTAPANGVYTVYKTGTAAGQYIQITNVTTGLMNFVRIPSATSISNWLPVRKGDVIKMEYNLGGSTSYFRFFYAQGSESEAQ